MGEILETIDHEAGINEQSIHNGRLSITTTDYLDGKYLTFTLAEEEYGISILKVKEIIGMMPITPVPQTPDFIKGIINLRGKVIPVIDMRMKFDMGTVEYTERTCIVVVEVGSNSGTIFIGIVVDSVSEVLNIKAEEIEKTPAFGCQLDTGFILGMAKTEAGVKILLDINRVLGVEDIDVVGGLQ